MSSRRPGFRAAGWRCSSYGSLRSQWRANYGIGKRRKKVAPPDRSWIGAPSRAPWPESPASWNARALARADGSSAPASSSPAFLCKSSAHIVFQIVIQMFVHIFVQIFIQTAVHIFVQMFVQKSVSISVEQFVYIFVVLSRREARRAWGPPVGFFCEYLWRPPLRVTNYINPGLEDRPWSSTRDLRTAPGRQPRT